MKENKMSKIMLFIGIMATVSFGYAGPHGCGPHGPCHTVPPPHHHHHSGEHAFWGSFAGSAIGTLVGTALTPPPPTVLTTPTVVTQPVIVQQPIVTQPVVVQQPTTVVVQQPRQVWIDGRYVEKVVNGVVVREWVPGHYETR